MKVYTTDKIRNVAVLGHGGGGKSAPYLFASKRYPFRSDSHPVFRDDGIVGHRSVSECGERACLFFIDSGCRSIFKTFAVRRIA